MGIVGENPVGNPDDGVEYAPTPYETFFHAMKSVRISAGTFLLWYDTPCAQY